MIRPIPHAAQPPRYTQDPPAGRLGGSHPHSCNHRWQLVRGSGAIVMETWDVSISQPCLPHSPVHQLWPLQPSCPLAPPQRLSRHCQCPRCVSAPPFPTVGKRKAAEYLVLPWACLGTGDRMMYTWTATSTGMSPVCQWGWELSGESSHSVSGRQPRT